MNRQLLLATSFGTTFAETCEKNIGAVEQALADSLPDWEVHRAFTSGMVRRALEKKGTYIDDVPSALEKAVKEGVKKAAILPTHLLYGEEYEKLCGQAEKYQYDFETIQIGKPLLASTEDMLAVVEILSKTYPQKAGRCYVFMGHGTTHYVNPVYAALETMFRYQGRDDVFVGTVEAYPDIHTLADSVVKTGFSEATIAPLMLVAGDHAVNDMAGEEEDSWKSILTAKGLKVNIVLQGLGEYPEIRGLYIKHAKEVTEKSQGESSCP